MRRPVRDRFWRWACKRPLLGIVARAYRPEKCGCRLTKLERQFGTSSHIKEEYACETEE